MSAALAKIHIAKKELGLHDDDYRAILTRETGQNSAKGLSDAQAGRVLEAFKALGWKPQLVVNNKKASKSPPFQPPRAPSVACGDTSPAAQGRMGQAGVPPKQASGGYKARAVAQSDVARKARALWISLWQLGVVRDKSESALERFGARQLKVERLVWADQQQMYKLIEALKAMGRAGGWRQDDNGLHGVYALKALKAQLVEAQCRKLGRVCPPLSMKSLEQLTDMAADLGQHVRALG